MWGDEGVVVDPLFVWFQGRGVGGGGSKGSGGSEGGAEVDLLR